MSPALTVTKLLMRLHRWRAAATLLARMPFAALDATARGRLSYALLMLHRTHPAQARQLLNRVCAGSQGLTAPLLLELATIAIRVQSDPQPLLHRALSCAPDEPTRTAAHTLLDLHAAHAADALHPRIASLINAAELPPGGLLILVPVSSRYLALWALWIEQVRTHIPGTVIALALDTAALEHLQTEPGVTALDARDFFAWKEPGSLHDISRGVLWQVRTLVLRGLLHRNRTVLVLDLDAVALAPVQPIFDALPEADLIAQEDHSIPMDVDRQLGFILCCGFMLWRPTPAAIALADRFAMETMVERDDQLALNHLLAREGVSNLSRAADALRFRSGALRIACPKPQQVSRTLNAGTVVRHFQQEGHTVPQLREALGLAAKPVPGPHGGQGDDHG